MVSRNSVAVVSTTAPCCGPPGKMVVGSAKNYPQYLGAFTGTLRAMTED
jgi:hypothetical protein